MHITTSKFLIFDDHKAFQIHGKYVKSLIKIKIVHYVKQLWHSTSIGVPLAIKSYTNKKEVAFYVIIKE
jgi:hypothetical protein